MTDQHEDPKFDAWLKDVARTTYHAPRTTPREEMWARIAAERQRRAGRVIELRPWMRWAVAAAAVLVLGIGIGRWTVRQQQQPAGGVTPVATSSDSSRDSSRDLAYEVAATQYLSRTEAFLTSFRADAHTSASSARFATQARDLLTTTQLMLDSPAGSDPHLRALLEDLELVLVQISELNGGAHDTDLITQGMNQSNVLPKLRSAIPAGPGPVRTQGVL
ncbi:MAG: hypothetical protein DMD54_06775 [Gemmatimonadetes bacterium]|nr:MAG: hypothetical protein DMD54_06775 [Gemmatimonadota bacterium]